MSFNDRCGEAAEILAHGGVIPAEGINALVDLLRDAKDTCNAPWDLVYAILRAPENSELRAMTADGEWFGDEVAVQAQINEAHSNMREAMEFYTIRPRRPIQALRADDTQDQP